jgi:hypothetical protein
MNDCKKCEWLFDDVFYGKISKEDNEFLEHHLENCSNCRLELKRNNSMLSGISIKSTSEVPTDFWDNYNFNLHQRLLSEGLLEENQPLNKHLNKQIQMKNQRPQYFAWLSTLLAPRWALQIVTAVILVIIGIFIGRFLFNSSPIRVEDFASTKSPNSFSQAISTQTMITLQQMDRFLDRSRVILMAIENFDPETESTHAINLPYQKEISRQLVNQAVALKIDLSKTRQRRLKELLGELEVILMQIANIDSGSEMETLQLVKGGRYIRGILYKIRLIDLQRSKYITSKNRSI